MTAELRHGLQLERIHPSQSADGLAASFDLLVPGALVEDRLGCDLGCLQPAAEVGQLLMGEVGHAR